MKYKRSVKAIIGLMVLVLLLLLSNLTALATDPTWVTKASMSTARFGFQAEVINGEIYVLGGFDGTNYLSSVEKYNPVTNTWSTCASMSTARYYLQTEVINGKIYAIGGRNGSYLSSVEVYDPSTNTWTTLASMSTVRVNFQTEIINGKIYVFGGNNPSSGYLSSTEVYNPNTNTWSTLASMSTARTQFRTELIDGKIYAIGGSNVCGYLTSTEVYDPNTNIWLTLASMSTARYYFCSEVINEKIYVIGGENSSSYLNSVEEYDPANNSWTTKASLTETRSGFQTVVISGEIYALGGYGSSGYQTSLEKYNPITNTWITLSSMTTGRTCPCTTVINGTIYAIGGSGLSGKLASVEAYTPIAPPSAPTLTATAGDAQVTLNWNSVTDATSYNVYRATTSGGSYTQVATGVTGTTYTDTNLTNGTTYYYVVTATNDAGESAYSNEVSATPEAAWNGLLRITMTTGAHKEYILTAGQINTFIAWYNGNTSGSGFYMFNKTYNVGSLSSRKEYVAFNKIAFFEVMAYEEGSTSTPPTGSNTALLKVTMSTGDIMEYEMTNAQLIAFTDWYDSGASGSPTFAVSKAYNMGPFISRTDYLVFDKIVDFEVLEY